MREQREKWFKAWKEKGDQSPESVLDFHKTAGRGDDEVGVVLKRNLVGTVSITQFVRQGQTRFHYESVTGP